MHGNSTSPSENPMRNTTRQGASWTATPALLALLILAAPAQAGRPLQTEDAGVLDAAACEIEGAHLRTTVAGSRETETTLGLGCGVGFRSQVGVGVSRARADGDSATGAQLGGKTALWQGEGDGAPALTLAWSLGWGKDGGGWRHTDQALNAVATVPAGPGSVHLNLGHARDPQAHAVATTWGLAYEHDAVAVGPVQLAPMAEFFGDDRGSRWANLALRATLVPERVFLDLSVGRQLGGDKARLVTAGFKLAF
jgi:hypothetical protein